MLLMSLEESANLILATSSFLNVLPIFAYIKYVYLQETLNSLLMPLLFIYLTFLQSLVDIKCFTSGNYIFSLSLLNEKLHNMCSWSNISKE